MSFRYQTRYCVKCQKTHQTHFAPYDKDPPKCPHCGELLATLGDREMEVKI